MTKFPRSLFPIAFICLSSIGSAFAQDLVNYDGKIGPNKEFIAVDAGHATIPEEVNPDTGVVTKPEGFGYDESVDYLPKIQRWVRLNPQAKNILEIIELPTFVGGFGTTLGLEFRKPEDAVKVENNLLQDKGLTQIRIYRYLDGHGEQKIAQIKTGDSSFSDLDLIRVTGNLMNTPMDQSLPKLLQNNPHVDLAPNKDVLVVGTYTFKSQAHAQNALPDQEEEHDYCLGDSGLHFGKFNVCSPETPIKVFFTSHESLKIRGKSSGYDVDLKLGSHARALYLKNLLTQSQTYVQILSYTKVDTIIGGESTWRGTNFKIRFGVNGPLVDLDSYLDQAVK